MDFPHLKDTEFPTIDNVNVYKYQNNFDYARWNGKVSFKLLNVLWNSDYSDVPYFDTVEKRNAWFDSQDGFVGTLESLFNNTPENTVKIPIPYNDAYKYNYLVVDMPVQTSIDNPIEYEDEKTRVKRWFYFIEDIAQAAPSTTELILSVDYWTTFINTVNIPYLMLERGHAPMTKITADKFLENPIANNEYLLADDFNYGNDTVIQTSNYKPIGNGKKYVLFVAPYNYQSFANFGGGEFSNSFSPPSYADIESSRMGYQLQVNDYLWNYGYGDYDGASLPIHNQITNGVLNGVACFAIEGSKAREYFNRLATYHVHVLHGIQAVFILDETLFTKQQRFTHIGYDLWTVSQKADAADFKFTKALFGFDGKYADIAKLYTFPYSMLEVTDDEGNSFTARVENCGHVQMHTEVSLVYPFLNYNVFVSGLNGDGSARYSWQGVQDDATTKDIWASDFSKYMMNWEIPTYSLYISSETEHAVDSFADNQTKRKAAIIEYQNAMRLANTNRENTSDSQDTMVSNVAATGSTNTANVNRTTTANVADVAASGATMNTNRGVQNKANTTITDENNDCREDTVDYQNLTDGTTFGYTNNKLRDDCTTDNSLITTKTDIENDNASVSAAANGVANIANGFIGGGILGGITAGISAGASGVTTVVGIANNNAEASAMRLANDEKVAHTITYNLNMTAATNKLRNDVQARENTRDSHNTSTDNSAQATQVGNTVATNNANASRDKTAADSNASATQSTDNANAGRTRTTETNNATYLRNALMTNAKVNLAQRQREAAAGYRKARLQEPKTRGSYKGDFMPDAYKRRGIRFNVRTQTKAAIAQAGDAMLRFGYALHRVWDMSSGFHYGKEFTFWKAEDIWINDGTGTTNAATNAIGNILMKGVTVWREPEKIGNVGIYDNM